MLSQFSILGSCVSRNMFNSLFNIDYKSFFNINHSVHGISMISLMSKPIEVDKSLMGADRDFASMCVIEDLSKRYVDTLRFENLDYVLMDTCFDAQYGLIEFDDDSYISDTFWLHECDFNSHVKDLPKLNIWDNFEEYIALWKDSCDRFFKIVEGNKSHPRVILNCSVLVYRYCDNGRIVENESFKRDSAKNKYKYILDNYVMENYDVEVLPFDMNTLCDMNHIFGPSPGHYEKKYYTTKISQLKDIVARNNLLGYDNDVNARFRQFMRNRCINR